MRHFLRRNSSISVVSYAVLAWASFYTLAQAAAVDQAYQAMLEEERKKAKVRTRVQAKPVFVDRETPGGNPLSPLKKGDPASDPLEEGRRVAQLQAAVQKALSEQQDERQRVLVERDQASKAIVVKKTNLQIIVKKETGLEEQVRELEQRLRQTEEEKDKLARERKDLSSKIIFKESDVRRATKDKAKLEQELAEMKERQQKLAEEISASSTQSESLKKQLQQAQTEKELAATEWRKLKEELGQLEREFKVSQEKVTALDAELGRLTQELDEMHAQEKEIRQTLFTWYESLPAGLLDEAQKVSFEQLLSGAQLEAFLDNVSQSFQDQFLGARAQIAHLEDEKAELLSQSKQMKAQLEEQEKEFSRKTKEKDEQITILTGRIQSLEQEIQQLEKSRDVLQGQLVFKEKELKEMRASKERLEAEVTELKAQHVRTQEKIGQLEKKIAFVEENKKAAEAARDSISALLKAAEEAALSDKKSLGARISQLESELLQVRKKAETDQASIEAQYQAQLTKLREAHQLALGVLQDAVDAKQKDLSATEAALDKVSLASEAEKKEYKLKLQQAEKGLIEAKLHAEEAADKLTQQHELQLAEYEARHQENVRRLEAGQQQSKTTLASLEAEHAATLERLRQEHEKSLLTQKTQLIADKEKVVEEMQAALKRISLEAEVKQQSYAAEILAAREALVLAQQKAAEERHILEQAYLKQLDDRGQAHRKEIQDLERKHAAVQQELEETRALLSKTSTEGRTTQERLDALTQAFEKNQAKMVEAQRSLEEQHRQAMQMLRQEQEENLRAFEKRSLAEKEEAVRLAQSAFDQVVARMTAERKVGESTFSAAKEELRRLQEKAEERTQSLKLLHQRELEDQQQGHLKGLESVQELLSEKEQQVAALQAALEDASRVFEQEKQTLEERIVRAQEAFDLAQQRVTEEKETLTQSYLKQLEERQREHEQALNALEMQKAEIQQELETMKARLSAAQAQAASEARLAEERMTELQLLLKQEKLNADIVRMSLMEQQQIALSEQAQGHARIQSQLKAQIEEQSRSLLAKENELAERGRMIESVFAQIKSLQSGMDRQSEMLAQHEKTIEAYEEECKQLEKNKARLGALKDELVASLSTWQANSSRLEKQLTESQGKVKALTEQLEAQKGDEEGVRAALVKEQARSAELASALEQNREKTRSLQSELSLVSSRLEAMQSDLIAVFQKLEREQKAAALVTTALTEVKDSWQRAKADIEELTSLNEFLNQEVSVLQEFKSDLSRRFAEQEQKFEGEKRALEKRLAMTLQEVEVLNKQLLQAHSDLDDLLQSDSATDEREETLANVIRRVRVLVRDLRTSKQTMEANLVDAGDVLSRLETEKERLANELKRLDEESQRQVDQMKEADKALQSEHQNVVLLRQTIKEKDQEIASIEEDQQELRQKLLKQENRIEALEQEIRSLREREESLRTEKAELEAILHAQEQDAERLKRALKELDSTLSFSTQKLRFAEEDAQSVDEFLNESNRKARADQERINELEEEREKLQTELSSVQQQLEIEEEESMKKLEQFAEFIRGQIQALETTIAAQKASLEEAERERINSQARLTEFRVALEKERETHEKLKTQHTELSSEYEDLQKKASGLKQQLVALGKEKDRLDHNLKLVEEQKQTAEQLARKEQKNGVAVLKELEDAKRRLAELEKQNATLAQMLGHLQGKEGHRTGTTTYRHDYGHAAADPFKTPERRNGRVGRTSVVEGSPLLEVMINPKTPFEKKMVRQLHQQFGLIDGTNAMEAFNVMLQLLESETGEKVSNLRTLTRTSGESGIGSGVMSPPKAFSPALSRGKELRKPLTTKAPYPFNGFDKENEY